MLGVLEKQENIEIRDKLAILFSKNKDLVFGGGINIYNDYNSLWVYSNLCSWRMVGDALVPLLRVISVKNSNNSDLKILHESYNNPHYLHVSQNFFQTADVYITNTLGEPIPFQPGQVVVTLHFKPQVKN